ncbi:universal stress protein [Citricoccus sp. SGAir0253]|uniref:universal stress protein n=1 Tax=Citricoccus sp. SGAir0253 TaxID=2567881 RepID=UPI0010CD33AC|nr:universal stress protein [Citricoccus sp. SGAir0253]QCU77970.1 universal stress protein [Citricoccus sp. SGAir0253]
MSLIPARPWHGDPTGTIVVFGVLPDQDPAVIHAAAAFTARMGGSFVCVWADRTHVTVQRHLDGTMDITPLDPDGVDDPDHPGREAQLYADLLSILGQAPAPWRFRYATGAPARALHEIAEELDAVAIALGTREKGFAAWAAEHIDGPVAVRLAQHQHRPVILIPHPDTTATETHP